MSYVILAVCLSISAVFAVVFWILLIIARQSDEMSTADPVESDPSELEQPETGQPP